MVYYFGMAATFLHLDDVDAPKVHISLPPLRIGDKVLLAFRLQRKHLGRDEVLTVQGEFRITSVVVDATQRGGARQIIHVNALGVAPSWQAVKRKDPKVLGKPRYPRTTVF